MRILFILLVVGLVGVYCVGVKQNYGTTIVPDYHVETIDLGGDFSPDSTTEEHQEHFHELANEHMMPGAEPITIAGRVLPMTTVLTVRHYMTLYKERKAAGQPLTLSLKSTNAVRAMANRNLHLRDTITLKLPTGDVTYAAGEALTVKIIDALIQAKQHRVAVVGKGEIVDPQPATMLLIILIFLALVAALKMVLWEPMEVLVSAREAEISAGETAFAANDGAAEKLATERQRLRGEIQRTFMNTLAVARGKSRKEANEITNAAKEKSASIRAAAEKELSEVVKEAEEKLQHDIPALAQAIADRLLDRSTTN